MLHTYKKNRYVWIDWASMPQPSACPPSASKEEKENTVTGLGKAVKSIPAYVTSLSFNVVCLFTQLSLF